MLKFGDYVLKNFISADQSEFREARLTQILNLLILKSLNVALAGNYDNFSCFKFVLHLKDSSTGCTS